MAHEHPSSHSAREKELLEYWDEHKAFEKSVNERPEGKPYVFYDGPPFATGLPHYGHIVASVLKDVVPRFWTMRGYRVERKWGWDCHGLPIENIVEKKFDLNSKKDIEAFGVDVFNNRCHDEVMRYATEWKGVIRRLGRWVDMENAYKTMDLEYMESVWWVFKSLWEKGMIYEGYKPMHICPRCETALSNFEVNQGYSDVKDISVYVSFKLTSGPFEDGKLIAWTTTPWTLPGNALLAVNAEITYVRVEHEGEAYIVAKERVKDVFEQEVTVLEELGGSDLVGAEYEPLFPFFEDHVNAFRVVAADFVTTEDGTGIVHIAPGFGEDDMKVGERESVAPIMHVRMNGLFVNEVADPMEQEGYKVKDVPVRKKSEPLEVDIEVIKYLAHHGKLVRKQKFDHSYPHCWRCDTPLLNYVTTSWFVRVTDIKEKLVAANKEIDWVPENMKEGRFGKWLEGARDWAISRSRYWGTPLPIWRSEDGDVLVIGSQKELEEYAYTTVTDLHKHVVDGIVIMKDGKEYRRIPEVLDCWFESGSMPYAQLHYPFENEEKFDAGFPAEFIAEGQDQTRGWFYTLHVLANALFDMPAFKNVVVNGIVLAEDGKKMSKRLQNYPDPMDVMEKYGADAVRYYLMSSPVVAAENLRFSEKDVAEVGKKFINILNNVVTFYKLYAEHDDGRAPNGEHILDKWVLARLNETLKEETEAMETYDIQRAARVLQSFVTDLSTWYVRRSRDRFKAVPTTMGEIEGAEDRQEAIATLRVVLDTFAKMLAPFMPFLAEMVYQGIDGGFIGKKERLSVHLASWPVMNEVDTTVVEKMGEARAIVSRALEIREQSGMPIKQPLVSMTITVPSGDVEAALLEVILDEVNVKTAIVEKGELKVELDLTITPELRREGMFRDLTRRVNQLRKDAGKTIQDRITLYVHSPDSEGIKMLDEHRDELTYAVLAEEIRFEQNDDLEHKIEFRSGEQTFWAGF